MSTFTGNSTYVDSSRSKLSCAIAGLIFWQIHLSGKGWRDGGDHNKLFIIIMFIMGGGERCDHSHIVAGCLKTALFNKKSVAFTSEDTQVAEGQLGIGGQPVIQHGHSGRRPRSRLVCHQIVMVEEGGECIGSPQFNTPIFELINRSSRLVNKENVNLLESQKMATDVYYRKRWSQY